MLSRLIAVLRIPELRRKILLTLLLLAVYRMGFWIPLPIVDQGQYSDMIDRMKEEGGSTAQVMQVVALFSASAFGNATIFGLGIMPYISASIIFQLLGTVYPPLERLQKEGEAGRKKINEYTRYATVAICLLQSWFWIQMVKGGIDSGPGLLADGYGGFGYQMIAVITMTAGTVLLMWIGEQIDEYGIGNGISLLIMAGILARMPAAMIELLTPAYSNGKLNVSLGSQTGIDKLLLLAFLFIAVVVAVVAITQAQRRIPIQSAKHVRGRKVTGGTRQHLPLRVNQAGVMPIIFASSLLMIPTVVAGVVSEWTGWRWLNDMQSMFSPGSNGFMYNFAYVVLIYFFCYFWTTITFNPKDMANNLRDHGSFVPGYRPGQRTADYLETVMVRITYVGAAFLAIVAIIPTFIASGMNINMSVASLYGGTGLLIVVSVGLDLVQKIDSHLVMRNKAGLLEGEE